MRKLNMTKIGSLGLFHSLHDFYRVKMLSENLYSAFGPSYPYFKVFRTDHLSISLGLIKKKKRYSMIGEMILG